MNLFKKQTRAQLVAMVKKAAIQGDEKAYKKAVKKLEAMK